MKYILSENYVDLTLNEEKGYIRLKWKSDVTDEEYKLLWNTLLDEGLKYGVESMIIDQRALGKVSMQARAWLLISWIPKAKKKLGNHFNAAIIVSEKVLNKSGMQYLVTGIKKMTSFNLKFVQDIEDAELWLTNTQPQHIKVP